MRKSCFLAWDLPDLSLMLFFPSNSNSVNLPLKGIMGGITIFFILKNQPNFDGPYNTAFVLSCFTTTTACHGMHADSTSGYTIY